MPFFKQENVTAIRPLPGSSLRTPYGENLMLSRVEMEEGAVIPMHEHPHEQGGVVLEGRMQLTIDEETQILEVGDMYVIPPNTPHRAAAWEGPAVALDVFSPVREDYVEMTNKYIPEAE